MKWSWRALGFVAIAGLSSQNGSPAAALQSDAARPCALRTFQTVADAAGGVMQWKAATEIKAVGTETDSGLSGPLRVRTNLRTGAFEEYRNVRAQPTATGFDGQRTWYRDSSGWVHYHDSPDAIAAQVTKRYLSRHGYFWPERYPALFRCLGQRIEKGRAFNVMRIKPDGGQSVDVWINASSHLIDRWPTTTTLAGRRQLSWPVVERVER